MRHRLSLLILSGALAACGGTAPAAPPGPVPSIPAAPLSALDGSMTDLGTVLHGRPALVTLWATWCEACVGETSALNQLEARARPTDRAVVVGVAVGETRETVGAFAESHQLGYSLFVDEDFRVADALGERRVPTTLVVDRRGLIVYRGGALDRAGLAAFRQVLAEQ